jgi:hypothetical protein
MELYVSIQMAGLVYSGRELKAIFSPAPPPESGQKRNDANLDRTLVIRRDF